MCIRDSANTMHTLEGEERPVLTFGLEQGDVRAANLAWNRGCLLYTSSPRRVRALCRPGVSRKTNWQPSRFTTAQIGRAHV